MLLYLFLTLCFYTVAGFPSKWITDTSQDLSAVNTFTANPMAPSQTFATGIRSHSGSSGACEIETWTTPAKFKASTKYEITVKARTASALLLQASTGTWEATSLELTSGNKISNTKTSEKVRSHTFLWTSPATGSVEFRAVCISGYGKTGYVAEEVRSTESSNAIAPVIAATVAPSPDASAVDSCLACVNLGNTYCRASDFHGGKSSCVVDSTSGFFGDCSDTEFGSDNLQSDLDCTFAAPC